MTTTTEITGTFIAEKNVFDNEDSRVIVARLAVNGSINGEVLIKGEAAKNELQPDQVYDFHGRWVDHPKWGPQFHFKSFDRRNPITRDAIVSYLVDAGRGHGFGEVRASLLFDLYGESAVREFRENPDKIAELLAGYGLYLGKPPANQIAAILRRDETMERCHIELRDLLRRRGFRSKLKSRLIGDYGLAAATRVRRNPYLLLGYPGCGCGFALTDKMYLDIGHDPAKLKRQALCAWHAIASNRDGHTWMPRALAERGIRQSIGGAKLQIDKAIRLAIRGGLLAELHTDGAGGPIVPHKTPHAWLADREKADREQSLAKLIAEAMAEPFEWPAVELVQNIDGEQPGQLALALRGPIAILTGRPGGGKTRVASNFIPVLQAHFGEDQIGIGAPTNLAAHRLTEALAENGCKIRARTWHSLLGRSKVRGLEWNHNKLNPFPFKVIVGDESSMADTKIAESIFQARARGTLVLLIGDTNQLPPIDHGAPLRDMITAGLPCGELKIPRRNSGGIVEACSAIVDGRKWGAGDNLEIIQVDDEPDQIVAVLAKHQEARDAGFDPIWDCRVIVPRNETRRTLNKVLQRELNPQPGVGGSPFRVGDKIINRESGDFKIVEADLSDAEIEVNDKGDSVRVANGELARVLEVRDDSFIAKVSHPTRVIRIPRGKVLAPAKEAEVAAAGGEQDKTGTGCSWDLAYAVTFHSSQGSEFPYAILVASSRDGMLGSRELVYTGISRGKNKAVLIGMKERVFDRFCKRVALAERKTLLRERILLESAKLELGSL